MKKKQTRHLDFSPPCIFRSPTTTTKIIVGVAHQAAFGVPAESAAQEVLPPAQRVEPDGSVSPELFLQGRHPHEGHHALPEFVRTGQRERERGSRENRKRSRTVASPHQRQEQRPHRSYLIRGRFGLKPQGQHGGQVSAFGVLAHGCGAQNGANKRTQSKAATFFFYFQRPNSVLFPHSASRPASI